MKKPKRHPGRIAAAAAVGLGTALLVRRRVAGPKLAAPLPAAKLEPWEQQALAAGDVGDPEGDHPPGVDDVPIGSGKPAEHCLLLGVVEWHDDLDPHCVANPLADSRFAPVGRGAPMVAIPSSSIWPVRTKHSGRLTVSYWTANGVRGYSGRAFAASRVDSKKGQVRQRKHAGVDLFARAGDVVVAPEDATVLAVLPFNAGTWAVYLRSRSGDRVVNLGEVENLSWREFGVAPGIAVVEGQPLARVGVQAKGSTMLHLETYEVGAATDEDVVAQLRAGMSWLAEQPAPAWLRDPSGYLVMAASRTYKRGVA